MEQGIPFKPGVPFMDETTAFGDDGSSRAGGPCRYTHFENQIDLVVRLALQTYAENPVPTVLSHK